MEQKSLEVFESMPVPKAVFKNALPAMAAMLMVLVYNLADTFFIGQTHDALQVAAVSLATPVIQVWAGSFGYLPCVGRGKEGLCKESMLFLYVGLRDCGCGYGGSVLDFYGADTFPYRGKFRYMGFS